LVQASLDDFTAGILKVMGLLARRDSQLDVVEQRHGVGRREQAQYPGEAKDQT
jgi:hypothetical protein